MTSKTIPHNISILQHEGDAALTKVSVVEDDPPPPPNVSPPRSPSPPWPERATDEEDESAEEIAVTPIRRLRTPSPGPRESLRSLYNVLAPAKTRPQDAPRTPTTTPGKQSTSQSVGLD